MKWRRSKKSTRAPGQFAEANVRSFMRTTLPTVSPVQAQAQVQYLRGQGWSEEWIAQFILPYMPPEPPPPPAGTGADPGSAAGAYGVVVPPTVSREWLDHNLPAMDRGQMRRVVEELERRGWSSGTVAMAVLPHLLPKLGADEQQVILRALADMGMTEEEIRAATARR